MTVALLGREASMVGFRRTVAELATGTGGCVVIEGTVGIGKTRMLQGVIAEAAACGNSVAAVCVTELDRLMPYAVLRRLLEGSRSAGLDGTEFPLLDCSPLDVVHLLGTRIEAVARHRPLLIAIDDAHWADELTSLVLRALIPTMSTAPVLWVLTRRPAPLQPGCAQATIEQLLLCGARRHRLGPIPRDAATEMCRHLVGAEPDASVLSLADRCDGNPFLLKELLTALQEAGQVRIVSGCAALVGRELPVDFVTAVDQHLQFLSHEARWLLMAASVLGRPFTIHEIAAVVGSRVAELLPAAAEAVGAEILVERGPELAFRHELIREALYSGLGGPVRATLHREASTTVQREGRSPTEAVEHLIRSGRIGDGDAADVLRRGVAQVAHTAPSTVADMILRMLDVLGIGNQDQIGSVSDATRPLVTAGRVAETVDRAASRLFESFDDRANVALLLGLSEALYVTGRHGTVVECTSRALAKLRSPEGPRADLLAIRAWGLIGTHDLAAADDVARQALERGAAAQPYAILTSSTAARSVVARMRGELDASVKFAREAVRIADETEGDAHHRHPRLWLCQALTAMDRFGEAESVCIRGQREADRSGTRWPRPFYKLCRAELRFASGRLDKARTEAEAGLQDADRAGALTTMVLLLTVLGRMSIHRAELAEAAAYLHRAELLVAECDNSVDELGLALAELHDARDQPLLAMDALASVYEALPHRQSLFVHEPRAAAELVGMAQRVGCGAQAEIAAAAAHSLAERNPDSSSLAGAAAHAAGLLRGDFEALRRAVSAFRSCPRPLARASAVEDLARAEHAAGHCEHAKELLREAAEFRGHCGAQRDADRARAHLRQLEQPRRRSERWGRLHPGWRSLTRSELRVVRLVAEGLTNREVAGRLFLSPHTVDSHLRHSFAKLDVSSRVALTRHVLVHDTDDQEFA